MATHLIKKMWALKIWSDTSGQDLLEYAMYCAAILVLYVAFSPNVAASVSTIFSKIGSTMSSASTAS